LHNLIRAALKSWL